MEEIAGACVGGWYMRVGLFLARGCSEGGCDVERTERADAGGMRS